METRSLGTFVPKCFESLKTFYHVDHRNAWHRCFCSSYSCYLEILLGNVTLNHLVHSLVVSQSFQNITTLPTRVTNLQQLVVDWIWLLFMWRGSESKSSVILTSSLFSWSSKSLKLLSVSIIFSSNSFSGSNFTTWRNSWIVQ